MVRSNIFLNLNLTLPLFDKSVINPRKQSDLFLLFISKITLISQSKNLTENPPTWNYKGLRTIRG